MQLTQAVLSGIQIGLIYALVAVGLTIIWGLMGMINFAAKTFTRPKDLIIDYAGIRCDQDHQNILAGGIVARIGWDGGKHALWPWDKAAQTGYTALFPTPSWSERGKHPAP